MTEYRTNDPARGIRCGLDQLRARLRLRRVLEASAVSVAAIAAVLLLSLLLMDFWLFAPSAVTVARVLVYATVALSLGLLVLPRILRRPSDPQMAEYAEHHAPDLDALVRTAVESLPLAASPDSAGASTALTRRLLVRAGQRIADRDPAAEFEHRRIRRASLTVIAVFAVATAFVFWGPGGFRHGVVLLWLPGPDAASPYRVELAPGSVSVIRGADQVITARAEGFEPASLVLHTRVGADGKWQTADMKPGAGAGTFEAFLFDLEQRTEYYVAGDGVQSPRYRLEVVPAPEARRIDLLYQFPPRSGRTPELVTGGGDIRAVEGTRVEVRVTPEPALSSGRLRLDGERSAELSARDGVLVATLDIVRSGYYRVELPAADGRMLAVTPDYAIESVADALPRITIRQPGRDIDVTSVEEVEFDVGAADDVAVRSLNLVLWVNGDAGETFPLADGAAAPEVEARHVLYLEDRKLAPGDLIAYYVQADDAARDPSRSITSDLYFMEVRPFDREYRRARGGGSGGSGQAGDDALAAQQRQMVIALFKLKRDREGLSESAFEERNDALRTAQARIRDRVDAINRRLSARAVVHLAPALEQMLEALPRASAAMLRVEALLPAHDIEQALPPAREALLHLQRADAAFREVQVAQGHQAGGGVAASNDLSNLFRLELDKFRNRYEHVQRGRSVPPDQQLDEAIRKLRSLARRQQQELERQARRDARGMDTSDSQSELAQRVENILRELERLTRHRPGEELNDALRAAREAAEAMHRGSGPGDSRLALDRLREAERLLERGRAGGLVREIDVALHQAESLVQDQNSVRSILESSPAEAGVAEVLDRKDQMISAASELETQIDRLVLDSQSRQPGTAGRLRDARRAMETGELAGRMERSQRLLRENPAAPASGLESRIADTLEQVRARVALARESAAEAGIRQSRSLAALRELVRSQDAAQRQLLAGAVEQAVPRQQGSAGSARAGAPGGVATAESPQEGDRTGPGGIDFANLQRQFVETANRLQALQPPLQLQQKDASDLDIIIDALRAMGTGSPKASDLALRHSGTLDRLKALEKGLRFEDSPDEITLVSAERTEPKGVHRALADEYFRRLSEAGARESQ